MSGFVCLSFYLFAKSFFFSVTKCEYGSTHLCVCEYASVLSTHCSLSYQLSSVLIPLSTQLIDTQNVTVIYRDYSNTDPLSQRSHNEDPLFCL